MKKIAVHFHKSHLVVAVYFLYSLFSHSNCTHQPAGMISEADTDYADAGFEAKYKYIYLGEVCWRRKCQHKYIAFHHPSSPTPPLQMFEARIIYAIWSKCWLEPVFIIRCCLRRTLKPNTIVALVQCNNKSKQYRKHQLHYILWT